MSGSCILIYGETAGGVSWSCTCPVGPEPLGWAITAWGAVSAWEDHADRLRELHPKWARAHSLVISYPLTPFGRIKVSCGECDKKLAGAPSEHSSDRGPMWASIFTSFNAHMAKP